MLLGHFESNETVPDYNECSGCWFGRVRKARTAICQIKERADALTEKNISLMIHGHVFSVHQDYIRGP